MTAPDWNAIEETLLEHAAAIALERQDASQRSVPPRRVLAVCVRPGGAWDGTVLLPRAAAAPAALGPDLVVVTFDADAGATALQTSQQIRAAMAHERERPRCRDCGCTDEEGCAEGCWWVERDLCSGCSSHEESVDGQGE